MRSLFLTWCLLALAAVDLIVPSLALTHATSNFPIELDELERLGFGTEQLLEHLNHLADGHVVCGLRGMRDMRKHLLTNTSVTCNDGSTAGYYIRTSQGSERWLVYLEGGWFCFDETSCRGRWMNTPHLMSSNNWPELHKGSGILSWNPEENPFLYNANLVYVPYCSSDTWSGTFKTTVLGEFSFMGYYIVQEVMKDLVAQHGMDTGSKLYLAGSSAGGTGVLVNLDTIASQLAVLAPRIAVRGIADSGWFLDNEQYKTKPCINVHSCAPSEVVKRGIKHWRGAVPTRCSEDHKMEDWWKCYFGYRIYPTLRTPVFVVQHLFDEAQISADNVGAPIQKDQWQYIHNLGQDTKRTLLNVSAVFAPACLSHILLSRHEWQHISINGVTLPQALQCWETGRQETNHYVKRKKGSYMAMAQRLLTGEKRRRSEPTESSASERSRNRKRHGRKRRRKERKRKKNRKDRKRQTGKNSTTSSLTGRRRPSRSSRNKRSSLFFDHHDFHHMRYHANQCSHHRLDHCAWPQCNLSCPKIRNPFTGEEMDFIDLLMQFGLDLSSFADALGLDLDTLQTMDHELLLQLLINNS